MAETTRRWSRPLQWGLSKIPGESLRLGPRAKPEWRAMTLNLWEYDQLAPSARRRAQSIIKLDRWALADLLRPLDGDHMTAPERWLFVVLCLSASPRDGTYKGTITDLSDYSGIARHGITKHLATLRKRGLIALDRPFTRSGHGGSARILVWDDIVGITGSSWSTIRQETLALRPACEACGLRVNLHVHHRTYERSGHEDPSDLVVLCTKHHRELHAFQRRLGLSVEDATEQWLLSQATD